MQHHDHNNVTYLKKRSN